MLDDLRSAVRNLLRSPGFTLGAGLVLALGIGATGAMFVVVDAYYLRPLPGIAEPGRLVNVRTTLGGRAVADLTYLDYADLRAWSRAFSGLAAWVWHRTGRRATDRSRSSIIPCIRAIRGPARSTCCT